MSKSHIPSQVTVHIPSERPSERPSDGTSERTSDGTPISLTERTPERITNTDHIPYRIRQVLEIIRKVKPLDIKPMCHLSFKDTSWLNVPHGEYIDIHSLMNKRVYNFKKVSKFLGFKTEYITSGSTGNIFRAYDPNEPSKSYAIKMAAYTIQDEYGSLNDSKRPENAELILLKLMSAFVTTGDTPHLVLPIFSYYTDITNFTNCKDSCIQESGFTTTHKKYNDFIARYENGDYYENVSVLVSEWVDGGDLLKYLRKNYRTMSLETWRILFFQLFSTLAIIHNRFPGFRHNDLKANNVLIQETDITVPYFEYNISGQKYKVPNIKTQLRIWDFDFSCIVGLVHNSKVDAEWTTRLNVKSEQNRYYDIHYFFNTLIKKGFLSEILTSSKVHDTVKEFIRYIVPPEYSSRPKAADKGRLLENIEFLTPGSVIKNHVFFKSLRTD